MHGAAMLGIDVRLPPDTVVELTQYALERLRIAIAAGHAPRRRRGAST